MDETHIPNDEQLSAKEVMRRKRKAAYEKQKAVNKELRAEHKEAVKLEKAAAKKKRDELLKSLLVPASTLPVEGADQ